MLWTKMTEGERFDENAGPARTSFLRSPNGTAGSSHLVGDEPSSLRLIVPQEKGYTCAESSKWHAVVHTAQQQQPNTKTRNSWSCWV